LNQMNSMESRADQRAELQQALEEAGMRANTFTARDGKEYLVLPLLDSRTDPMTIAAEDPELRSYFLKAAREWEDVAYLFICSGGQSAPWKIGVIGYNGYTRKDYYPGDWQEAADTGRAVEEISNLWDNRDALLNEFIKELR
jgi:hypothetical protein